MSRRATWGSTWARQRAGRAKEKAWPRVCIGVSVGKVRQDRVSSLGLDSSNNFGGLWV